MSVDATGRFTLYLAGANVAPSGVGAQGAVVSTGQFSAQALSGPLSFSGSVASGGQSVSVTVRDGGAAVLDFTAPLVAAGAALPSAVPGTYVGTGGSASAYLTVDPTGHAALYASAGGATGGASLSVDASGTLTASDGSVAGKLDAGSSPSLTLTRLANQSVSQTIALTRTTRAKWTFMVFLNAANNLQQFAPLNVNQMEKVGSTSDVNIVVQWKQAQCSDCGNPTWVGTRRYYITRDNDTGVVSSPMVQNMGTGIDMGDWRELRNFIQWAQTQYPADHYALVIWNHGAGWRPTRAEAGRLAVYPRSVSIDSERNSEIQTWQLPQALAVTPSVDTVIFDASLMQMLEVAYEMRNSTSIVTGSEESPPGAGYVYDTFLSDLVSNPSMTAAQLGTQIVTRTLAAYGTNGDNTQSVVDTSKLQTVADRLDAFGTALIRHAAELAGAAQTARNNADSYAYPDNKDLWDYADLIRTGTSLPDVQTAATNLQTAISAAVIAEQHGSLHSHSHGIAIYVPAPINYLTSYSNLALGRTTSWSSWLQSQP
jgi:RNase P subunit RPR2